MTRCRSPASCMTRMDGDARGGAALSMRAITGAPIKLIGVGEKAGRAGRFPPRTRRRPHPGHGRHRRPGGTRISETIDQAEAEKLAAKMMKGKFDLEDYASPASSQISKMGSHVRHPRDAAGCRQAQAAARGCKDLDTKILKRQARDHLVHDGQGTPRSRTSSRPTARSASPPAPAPPCRRSTGC